MTPTATSLRLRRRALLQAAALGAVWPNAWAQGAFPNKPVRIVVPFAAGGPTDLMARAIAKAMGQSTGQPFIVDNKPGGGGVIGLSEIGRNPADGYTLVMPSILAVTNPALMPNYPFDTLKDFSPVTIVGFIPHALVVKPDFPAADLQALVKMGKQSPNSLSYASSGIGTSAHLAGALFAQRAGIQATHVPYRGAGPAVQDLLGGRVQFMFLDMSTALGQIQAGKLRALAVAPAQRFDGLPQVPTVAEQGYPGFDVHGWYGLLVKSGTPAPVVDALYREVKAALADTELRAMFRAQGIEPGGMPPAEYGEVIRKDLVQWRKTIAELGIKLD
ncbi:Bug family tripartite tricarboxylate transporter substrate binding protein [Pseudacidovorax intermedius]|uniref:Bug family tripartite tricarboxylate transporter substrate binding protein n=1 Tax=Pseudacidovorax intermedius TaxID=433924 RepID=UPI00034C8D12|nr:tripartite tricarboxylate transporter substrate binding protein [Pseudacidovorax intermedius]